MRNVVHVTHEAVQKFGGIGAVLQGLVTSRAYQAQIHRTVLYGPMDANEVRKGNSFAEPVDILFSSVHGIHEHRLSGVLERICHDYNIDLLYGIRDMHDPHNDTSVTAEVVLMDAGRINGEKLNGLKAALWEHYGVESNRYEQIWDYELYLRLAVPARAIFNALGIANTNDDCVVMSHEFMGMPTALAVKLDPKPAYRTVFYAHEVTSIRKIVEDHPGHDLTFYNVLDRALAKGHYVDDLFGPQDHFHRHALVRLSYHCDRIFAVGDHVLKELRFLGPEFAKADICVTYNGIPFEQISLEQKLASKERLQDYAEVLLGDRPDYIFTHVSRMLISKAMWRDIRVLEQMEKEFRRTGKTAVLFVLSTEIGPRQPEDIRDMEDEWRWPVAHREQQPDLSYGEAMFYQGVQEFNAKARNIKIVFVNQFGWNQAVCGDRMPAEMQELDIRRGSDVEFGQSVYEPFGIAQLEPLTFGGICAFSWSCGCAGFIKKASTQDEERNFVIGEYQKLDKGRWTEKKLLSIDRHQRDKVEARVGNEVAHRLLQVLPANEKDMETMLRQGYDMAKHMSWEIVAGQFVMPQIEAICKKLPQSKAEVA
jgi:hypothetical protein